MKDASRQYVCKLIKHWWASPLACRIKLVLILKLEETARKWAVMKCCCQCTLHISCGVLKKPPNFNKWHARKEFLWVDLSRSPVLWSQITTGLVQRSDEECNWVVQGQCPTPSIWKATEVISKDVFSGITRFDPEREMALLQGRLEYGSCGCEQRIGWWWCMNCRTLSWNYTFMTRLTDCLCTQQSNL